MENALLGDAQLKRLEAEGTATQEEKDKAMQELQDQAAKLASEQQKREELEKGAAEALAMRERAEQIIAEREAE